MDFEWREVMKKVARKYSYLENKVRGALVITTTRLLL